MGSVLIVSSFVDLLFSFSGCFTKPSGASFLLLAQAWVLTTGRRTVTNLIRTAGKAANKSHDAYQYFFSGAVWSMQKVWLVLIRQVIAKLVPSGVVRLLGDDTLFHHSGPKIFGAGWFRDAVRSMADKVAYGRGHNWAVLSVVVSSPFGKTPIALPIMARLCPKKSKETTNPPTLPDLMEAMIRAIVAELPDRRVLVALDGGYSCLVGRFPDEDITVVARLRRDAALWGPKPPPTGRPGRPRKRGQRLPAPRELAADEETEWETVELVLRGKQVVRHLFSMDALWYHVQPDELCRVVLVRDPEHSNDYWALIASDTRLEPAHIASLYSDRWAIEVAFREAKQQMGAGDPQARTEKAVRRQAPFALLLQSLVKLWFLCNGHERYLAQRTPDPWYLDKETISFADMLATLRRTSWTERFFAESAPQLEHSELLEPLIRCASRAA